jgi:cytochrome oxidase Cu insertion factor (SCO1/SenC/PrrC family)
VQNKPRALSSARSALTIFLVVGLSACSSGGHHLIASANTATQASNGRGTEFDLVLPNNAVAVRLVDQRGVETSLAALRGKYLVIAPFLTICQEVCPMVSANFRRLSAEISKAGLDQQIALIELTVDPETDTPARLRAYQKIFAVRANWSFYTGRTADMSKVLGAFGIAFEKRMLTAAEMKSGSPDWLTGRSVDHDVSHQDVVIIVGPDGHERWIELGTANTDGASIPDSINKYLSSEGKQNLRSPDPMGSWTIRDVLNELSKLGGFKFD